MMGSREPFTFIGSKKCVLWVPISWKSVTTFGYQVWYQLSFPRLSGWMARSQSRFRSNQ